MWKDSSIGATATVVTPDGGMRQLAGADPLAIRRELAAVCASFNSQVSAFSDVDAAGVLDRARAAAALYAGILRVHPFADGNHRTAFVALSAALWSLGLPNVDFDEDDELTAHDQTLAPALSSNDGSVEPFATLLTDHIERSPRSQS